MKGRGAPRVFSVPTGVAFLPEIARALMAGALVPDFVFDGDPLSLADVTIYVPTRRAARVLRTIFAERAGAGSAILPVIRPLGEFDEDQGLFELGGGFSDLPPPIAEIDRLLLLAPLVQKWKRRLPDHIKEMFDETVVVPASAADALWLARDLAALMDEIETEGGDWTKLGGLVPGDLAGWWQVTLDFLAIVTDAWPALLQERLRSNPAAYRDALIRSEARRLAGNPPPGPVIAAGSTGSVPATGDLLAVIASLPRGAVVLPGLDRHLDDEAWSEVGAPAEASVLGHPQFGLAKLIKRLCLERTDVIDLVAPSPTLAVRASLISDALRPAEATARWASLRAAFDEQGMVEATEGIALVEAANEREEALAIAVTLRQAILGEGQTAALVTGDRDLARRVSCELQRFGITADDSGGRLLARSPAAGLLELLVHAAFRPGDPVSLLALLKHPLLHCGLARPVVRRAASLVELVTLRGDTGRPDVADLAAAFETRLAGLAAKSHPPFWRGRFGRPALDEARDFLMRLRGAMEPLLSLRGLTSLAFAEIAAATARALENLGRDETAGLAGLYAGDAGQKLVEFLRAIVAAATPIAIEPAEWPDVLAALIGAELVKPAPGGDGRVAIWGALEARLQSVDTLVLGGLNEGSWPRRAEADRFMSRLMKTGLALEPPERRIGLAAHDFWMAMGTERVVLTRSARAGDAPAVASRWLQRLVTFAGPPHVAAMRARGDRLIGWARALDDSATVKPIGRPAPRPPLARRPKRFSVTEIETLRRDPYAIYARRVLELSPLDGLLRDPGAAERGSLFHDILHRFAATVPDPNVASAADTLLAIGRQCFAELGLPDDVYAVWWPRFEAIAGKIIGWERTERQHVLSRHSEERAAPIPVGRTGVTLSGRADRIDRSGPAHADILDFKTGSSPSKGQAHTLLAPQLALEAALLERGAFTALGPLTPAALAFVRLRAKGEVEEESILEFGRRTTAAPALAETAWMRLDQLLTHYNRPDTPYLSRTLPFREGETDGDYDHLARVLEWSAGADDSDDAEAGE